MSDVSKSNFSYFNMSFYLHIGPTVALEPPLRIDFWVEPIPAALSPFPLMFTDGIFLFPPPPLIVTLEPSIVVPRMIPCSFS